tara:strand:+ start:912 stop:1373 length:462 start_codon:yes stop_codon:yes gene_type:complete
VKNNYTILWVVFLMMTFSQSCSNSPRYNRNNQKPAILKSNSKINKSQKVFYGISSYYGQKFHGKLTANGEVFDMYGLTAAHKTLPLNTIIRVTNKANDNSLILRVNDRGPYVGNRILDCSYGAALKLDFLNQGTAEIKIEVIEWGDNKYMKHK